MRIKPTLVRVATAALVAVFASANPALAMHPTPQHPDAPRSKRPARKLYTEHLLHGGTATVYADGLATIEQKGGTGYTVRHVAANLSDRAAVAAELNSPLPKRYVPNRVLVAFAPSVNVARDVTTVPAKTLAAFRGAHPNAAARNANAPAYTADAAVNGLLARLGVDTLTRIARAQQRSRLESMQTVARARGSANAVDLANVYVAHLTNARVDDAVRALQGVAGVTLAEPDWTVTTMLSRRATLSKRDLAQARVRARQSTAFERRVPLSGAKAELPQNYALQFNAQPMLAATGDNAIAAFDIIKRRFGQYPGQGEIVTNVSIGDITDVTASTNFQDPCQLNENHYGPTTHLIGGQHYIDWPSMPLIPVYTTLTDGTLSGSTEACNTDDATDAEIGLDFSMMAALPHELQRGGEIGSGYTDLLGIAPAAQYRLVVPQEEDTSTIVAALLAAATQTPAPNVITASIGFGFDTEGFPGRYLDEDPIVASAVQSIVAQNIVVCLAANDGTRTYTNAAIGPTGGSAATNLVSSSAQETSLGDVGLSTVPSSVIDTGSIDTGGVTTDDVALGTVAETRYTGYTSFSSGFGSRVNIAAPADNVLALEHGIGSYDAVDVQLSGGTSAAAPQVAAAAAVALQVARLAGHPLQKPAQVRTLLEKTGDPVAAIPQEDQTVDVGPRVDVGKMVTSLLSGTADNVTPAVARVSIMQRDSAQFDNTYEGRYDSDLDTVFTTDTNPAAIDIQGPLDTNLNQYNGMRMDDYITVAPEWEGIPAGARYQLGVQNGSKTTIVAKTPSARLLPAQLLAAAGLPIVSTAQRTVNLTYQALVGSRIVAHGTATLTFGASQATSERVFAPVVAPVTKGRVMQIKYDFSKFPSSLLADPQLVVLHPGRVNTLTGTIAAPSFTQALRATKGTINVPVSALQGDGIYGVCLLLNDSVAIFSDFAYTRVQTAASTKRANAPEFVTTLSGKTVESHYLDVPYNGKVKIAYDVTNVTGATGALLEVSAAGPNLYGSLNEIDNPNGSIVDDNGNDSGSVYERMLPGTKGTVTLTAATMGLLPTMAHVVRVIPVEGSGSAGEASDVSFITEDGLVPPDGGELYGGFAIDPSGTDGLISSAQPLADGEWISSIYRFNQKTLAVTGTLAQKSTGYDRYDLGPGGIVAPDTGLFRDEDDYEYTPVGFKPPSTTAPAFQYIPNVATASAPGGAWTPTLGTPTTDIVSNGSTSAPGAAAFVIRDIASIGTSGLAAFTSNVAQNTFGPLVDLTGVVGSGFGDTFDAFDYDASTNKGYVFAVKSFLGRSTTSIAVVDFTAGTASTLMNAPCGGIIDFSIDPVSNVGITSGLAGGCTSNYRLSLFDLTAATYSPTNVPAEASGTIFTRVTADPVNHLFFAQAPLSPDAGYNNNSLSSVYVLNAQGQQVETMEAFNFNYTGSSDWAVAKGQGHFFQVNGTTRRGYVFGPETAEIQPFTY